MLYIYKYIYIYILVTYDSSISPVSRRPLPRADINLGTPMPPHCLNVCYMLSLSNNGIGMNLLLNYFLHKEIAFSFCRIIVDEEHKFLELLIIDFVIFGIIIDIIFSQINDQIPLCNILLIIPADN